MCGRYAILEEETILEMREIINQVNQKFAGRQGLKAIGEIRPSNLAPVLRDDQGKVRLDVMNWGFPRWDKASGLIINARSETVLDKPLFGESFQSRRIIVPSSGFFEWDHKHASQREKYFFCLPGQVVYMAGFYNRYTLKDGSPGDCFVILTMPATEPVAAIHNRMPVIVPKAAVRSYLSPQADAAAMLANVSAPALQKLLWQPDQANRLDQDIGLGRPEN